MLPDACPVPLPAHAATHATADIAAGGGCTPLPSALWTLRPGLGGRPGLEALRPHLSDNEWARVTSFRDQDHAWSSAAARALLRAMLARFHGGGPLDWHFRTEPGGRPHVDMTRPPFPLSEPMRPRFSISHTRGLAACLVSVGHWPVGAELGVDAEWTARSVPARRLAARFFHPKEASVLAAVPCRHERQDLFMTLWTRKEAMLKALGLGIANNLNAFACLGEPPRAEGPADMLGPADAWTVGSETVTTEHRLSWAARGPVNGSVGGGDGPTWTLARPAHQHLVGWVP